MNEKLLVYNNLDDPPIQLRSTKPIIEHTITKINFSSIIHSNIDYAPLFSAFTRANQLTSLCYLFLRSYILYCYK